MLYSMSKGKAIELFYDLMVYNFDRLYTFPRVKSSRVRDFSEQKWSLCIE